MVGVPGSLVGDESAATGSESVSTAQREGRPASAAGDLPGRRVPKVVQRFLDTEAAGGLVLLAAAVVALVWVNSPFRDAYDALWRTEVSVGFGRFVLTEDLHRWVNDGLMAVFFFVVGLEIKRELVVGDLREPRVAAMPAIAAAGGMIVPALLFLAVAARGAGSKGWGIPIATDIAFAIGVVALLGSRVPSTLKLFLLTLAIVDDIGAIVVIAVFYSSDVDLSFLAAAVALLAVVVVLRKAGVVWLGPYVVVGVGVWLATLGSGVHATIAGVALGLLTPARPLTPAEVARRWAGDLADDPSATQVSVMLRLAKTSVSPAERLLHLLHPWTSFVVVPVFALANAGVPISAASFTAPGAVPVALGVVAGLVVGKVAGISLASWLAVRTGLGRLPEGATWPMVMGIGAVGGIGFTVSLFIAELAFPGGPLQEAAKIGVLAASALAATVGVVVLLRACRPAAAEPEPDEPSAEVVDPQPS